MKWLRVWAVQMCHLSRTKFGSGSEQSGRRGFKYAELIWAALSRTHCLIIFLEQTLSRHYVLHTGNCQMGSDEVLIPRSHTWIWIILPNYRFIHITPRCPQLFDEITFWGLSLISKTSVSWKEHLSLCCMNYRRHNEEDLKFESTAEKNCFSRSHGDGQVKHNEKLCFHFWVNWKLSVLMERVVWLT